MTTALVIPDPADYRPEVVADLSAAALAWVERADDLAAVIEMTARLAALEEYVAKRDPDRLGDLQLANRRAEARIGELLGVAVVGSRAREPLNHGRRHEFRRIARYLDDWYPDKGRQSRAQILNLIKRLERVADESAARVIIDADPGDGTTTTETGWVMHCGDAADTLATLPDTYDRRTGKLTFEIRSWMSLRGSDRYQVPAVVVFELFRDCPDSQLRWMPVHRLDPQDMWVGPDNGNGSGDPYFWLAEGATRRIAGLRCWDGWS